MTAWPDGQALIADWMRCASGCEFDGSPSSASSDPFVGFSVAVSVAQVVLGSVGSLTVPHCVVTLAAVADEVEVLDDEVVDDVDDVDDDEVEEDVPDDVDALEDVLVDDVDPLEDVSVGDVDPVVSDAGAGAAVDVEAAVADDDEVSPFAGDDDPPPHAATDALRTAIARRRA